MNKYSEETEARRKRKQAYELSVDQDILQFVIDCEDGKCTKNFITVGFFDLEDAEEIKKLTGKNVNGNRVVLDRNAIRHILERHGKNGKQDHSMQDRNDIARMGFVIENYDEIAFEGKYTSGYLDENGKPSPTIKISKQINGTFYVVEAISESKTKRNYVVTAYIRKQK